MQLQEGGYPAKIVSTLQEANEPVPVTKLPLPKVKSKHTKRSRAEWRYTRLDQIRRSGLIKLRKNGGSVRVAELTKRGKKVKII